ncbi:MAG: methyltransferase [Thermodesulfobacteriota bacterium]
MPFFHPDIWRRQLHAAVLYWVALPCAVLGGGFVLDRAAGLPRLSSPSLLVAGALALALGIVLIWRATVDLTAGGKATPSPFRPPRRLITTGTYRLCRHPMWLGYHLAALGAILLVGSPGALLAAWPALLWYSTKFLLKEERLLLFRFKMAYADYQDQVPFLLPWPRPHQKRK